MKRFLFFVCFIWLANCGGTATDGIVSISPFEPFLLTSPRSIIVGEEVVTIDAPNVAFQIKINNAGNSSPLTIQGLTLTVDGPKGIENISIDPVMNLFKLSSSNLVPNPRLFFAEVPPYQASYCMDKINFLKETSYSRSCADIANDTSKITDHGVSAANTVENVSSGTGTACCPAINSTGNLSDIFVVVGGLQNYSEQESVPTDITLSITAKFQGFFGTFAEPVANYNTQVFFNAKSN